MKVLHDPPSLKYYSLLEEDLERCFRFVEPRSPHFNVFSTEFMRIILLAASGVENVLKQFALLANIYDSSAPADTSSILKLHGVVTHRFPKFCSMQIHIPRYSILLQPWKDWTANSAPDWWTNGYNKIKHDLHNNAGAPSLQRALNSVAALQVVLLHYYRLDGKEVAIADAGIPKLMVPFEPEHPAMGASELWIWTLPDD